MTPEDFARSFATAFAAQDAQALASHLAPDGAALTLTGQAAESRTEAETAFQNECAGLFAQARLVSGRGQLRPLGPQASLLRQRFVVTGALAEDGTELPRFAAVMVAVLQENAGDWRAISLTFAALS